MGPVATVWLLIIPLVFCYNYTTKYLEVPVDHFSFSNGATFELKYLVNDEYWADEAPIFFYTGNEGTIESFAENTGFMFDIAQQFGALLVFAEHRYYGTSLPFGNLTFTSPKYLGYLTSNQALADFAYLISYLQKEYRRSDSSDKLPVVAFGGSYGGMLAAWLRMKYPASVIGAIASSAPIWHFQGLAPCGDFFKIATDVFQGAIDGADCSAPIRRSWEIIRNLTSTDVGKKWLSEEWKLCYDIQTDKDIDDIVDWVFNIIVNMAMVNYPYSTSFLVPLPDHPVIHFCSKLTNTEQMNDEMLLTTLGSALEVYTNFTRTTKCNDIDQTSPSLGLDAWDFQSCTEIIFPLCSTDEDMFENDPWNFTEFSEDCYKRWNVLQTNAELPLIEYGGRDISAASNIVFSNGLLDPWSGGGVLSSVSSSVVSIVIPDAAHHLDLRGKDPADPPSVLEARNFHIRNIKNWIASYRNLSDKKESL